ncbi:TIGR03885 family FMN-dependent LLM class oxidoreductase [Salinibacterium sp. ZJ454]|uniref:TIGR03885 family FMN-dependent LLM class oxidoreductase n=1 Tax=Salinibacterium sp. ZJ454 TaxID=2708339 RepID=UPI0014246218|nr:TIGR03885 family FMN-dependent LLM class oxidoreductase [Salinibacterium sp. ZJ454]
MTVIGFHASHEQIHPAELLAAVRRAEQAGFSAAMCSDHFAPWSARQGHSGFAWAWLGAALQATSLPLGVVNAPGQRYHPAIIAQAAATLEAMYPGRFWMALGSGEAVNEHITGDAWPDKQRRNDRLRESVDVMRSLFAGDEVSHRGEVVVDRAKLWTRPAAPPPMYAAAVTPETAEWAAGWADGLATVARPPRDLRPVIDAYRSAGGIGPIVLQVHLSVADTEHEALAIAHEQWRTNVFSAPLCWDVDLPETFDIAAQHVPAEAMYDNVLVASDPARFVDWLGEFTDLGFDEIYLHHVGQQQSGFIDTFGEHVLPQLDVTRKAIA